MQLLFKSESRPIYYISSYLLVILKLKLVNLKFLCVKAEHCNLIIVILKRLQFFIAEKTTLFTHYTKLVLPMTQKSVRVVHSILIYIC